MIVLLIKELNFGYKDIKELSVRKLHSYLRRTLEIVEQRKQEQKEIERQTS